MNPLFILLAALGATVSSDVTWEWRKQDQLDKLRKQLGLWPKKTFFPGNIARRLEWISSQFGLENALLAQRAAILMGNPTYAHNTWDESGISPMLPWLAWRFSKGDAIDLAHLLGDDGFSPEHSVGGQELVYDKEHAWSDLDRLIDWFNAGHVNLFQHDWKSAQSAEKEWFEKRIKPYTKGRGWNISVGKLVWRDPIRENTDEEGDWIVQWMESRDDARAVIEYVKTIGRGRIFHTQTVFMLQDGTGEPKGAVIAGDRINSRPEEILLSELESGEDLDVTDPAVRRMRAFMLEKWPDIGSWPGSNGTVLALATEDHDEAFSILEKYPTLINDEDHVGEYIAERAWETHGRDFVQKWANLQNSSPSHFSDLHTTIAQNQYPGTALLKWMDTGKWDHDLDNVPIKDGDIPPILHEYTHGYKDSDVSHMHNHKHDQVSPWELKVWDVLRHQDGPELEVRVQVFVLYDSDDKTWTVKGQWAMQFREDPSNPKTWQSSDEFDDFSFLDIIERNNTGSQRFIHQKTIQSILDHPSDFREIETTHSINQALREAWQGFLDTFEHAEIEDEDKMETYFQPDDLIEPSPDIIAVDDVLEAIDLIR